MFNLTYTHHGNIKWPEGSARIVKLEKPFWYQKGTQLNKFRSALNTLLIKITEDH